METKNYFSTDAAGNIIPGAQVYVNLPGTSSPAPGITNINGAPLANPFTAASSGLVQFKAPDGEYDLRVVGGGREFTIRIQCFDGVAFAATFPELFVADNIAYGSGSDSVAKALDELLGSEILSTRFGTTGDGSDHTDRLQAFMTYLAENGKRGKIPPGEYLISSQCLVQLNTSFSVEAIGAKFTAAVGFPSAQGMFAIANSVNIGNSFRWVGGKFDGKNQPYTAGGSGSGCSMLTVNASSCKNCHIDLERTYSGDDWLVSGSDTHVFVGGPSNIYVNIDEAIGAPDSCVYISRNIAGTIGQSMKVTGNYYKSVVGVIVKRQFETSEIDITATDCITGAATGTADITGKPVANAGHGHTLRVSAKRTEHPVFINASSNGRVDILAELMGVVIPDRDGIPGYTSPSVSALHCRGAQGYKGSVNAQGMNPLIAVRSVDCAVFMGPIDITDGTVQTVKNKFDILCGGLGVPFIESGPGTNDNTFRGKLNDMLSFSPVVVGALTKSTFDRGGIEFATSSKRMVDAAGNILHSVNDDGSISKGSRITVGPSYTDDYTGFANRAARTIVTGGSATAEQGSWQVNAGEAVLNAPTSRTAGAFRPGQFTLTTLPNAATFNGYEIDVTNATGGSKRCRSNGAVWQILNTTTTVS